ncbi:MAG TPA: PilZ domain-containing protein [Vicinamibacteria bacterium]|nr:PilZ domain-containing protein [Vicinamibacteria bacterium]
MSRPHVERPFRVPFVRACLVLPGGAEPFRALTVNVSVFGCYVASDEEVRLGHTLRVRFTVPGNMLESELVGVVVWVNPKQQNAIHSLPPGFGIRFLGLDPESRRRIDEVVRAYLERASS